MADHHSKEQGPGGKGDGMPPRFRKPGWKRILLSLAFLGLTCHAFIGTEMSSMTGQELMEMPGNVLQLLQEMVPPSTDRLPEVGKAVVETLQMCLVGTVFGVLVSLPLGLLAAKSLSPHKSFYISARGLISFCRTVPDLVWAIFFVIIVGLGPLAGMLTLMVDTIGFAGRFFAEAFEEVDSGPQEALSAIGSSGNGTFFSYVLPAAAPSCINTTMFSIERAVQSSVVLGLVGAGGIGMLLEEPMVWQNYRQASTVVLTIFVMLVAVEQLSGYLRRQLMRKSV